MSEKQLDILARLGALAAREPSLDQWSHFPWDDPAISRRILNFHLDPDGEQASRTYPQIEAEAAFLDGLITDVFGRPGHVCDLACGPGLYAMRLAASGHRVTGVDYGPAVIAYAKQQAAKRKVAVEFLLDDIRTVNFPNEHFDATILVYGQANAFPEAELRALLRKMQAWTAPDGLLLIDLASKWQLMEDIGRSWMVRERSALCDHRHLWLEEKRFYRAQKMQVHRIFVFDLVGNQLDEFRICHRAYELPEVELLLRETGWRLETVFGDLLGSPYRSDRSQWLVPVARPAHE